MADFKTAYAIERKHEGNYVNNPADRGKETYGGVARAMWPSWSGWPVLDAWKAKYGVPKWNQFIPELEPHVEAFYKALWDSKNFSAIQSQEIANIVYDWMINSGTSGIRGTQQVLRDTFKSKIAIDGNMGPDTIKQINYYDKVILYNAIKQKRIDFYNGLVAKNPTQSVFLKGWLARINSFPTLTKAGLGIAGILFGVGLFFLVRNYAKKH